MTQEDAQLGEFDLIRRFFTDIGAARFDVELGVGDDAALLRMPGGADLVAAVDTIVAGRHFPDGSDPRSISASHATEDAAAAAALIQRFEYPSPRVEFGRAMRGIATAAMDLSDGLAGDLAKLASASGLAAYVDIERLPLSTALSAVTELKQARDWALGAGDDYELLLAVPPQHYEKAVSIAARLNLRLSAIGELRPGEGGTWALNGKESAPPGQGFDHFRRASTQITV